MAYNDGDTAMMENQLAAAAATPQSAEPWAAGLDDEEPAQMQDGSLDEVAEDDELEDEQQQQQEQEQQLQERLRAAASEAGLDEASARRKTWNELRGVVSDLRRRMSGMSAGSVPGSVTFRSLPDGR